MKTLDYVLWAACCFGHMVLLFTLLTRGGARTFRVFTARIFYLLLRDIALYVIHRNGSAGEYARWYWLLAGGDYVLQIGVVLELARVVMRSTQIWFEKGLRQYFVYAGAAILAAGVVAQAISPPNQAGLDLWSIRADIFMSMVTCEVFVAMSAAANRLRRPWSRGAMAIGQGLSVWALVVLTGQSLQLAMGWPAELPVFDQIGRFVYLGTLIFWTVTFARRRATQTFDPDEVAPTTTELRELFYAKRN
ncbi:hypothetical protein [Acidisarcina polymorpha]|uniref:hypothetical protein n=1 Tax=Acidisarcina polymorpha TaxID=2211140 RepID=UPI000DEF0DB8|nr:hypothetical protein [Acidisarcina polymorpha]